MKITEIDRSKLTVMFQQYYDIKIQNLDTIVMYRLGDFYEMFFEDAEIASRVLDLTLTGRDCGLEKRAPMCGVPFHAAENYIAKLVANNYKVGICEQLTEPSKKGLVERGIIRVITPGTLVDDSMLDQKSNNYLCSIFMLKDKIEKQDIKVLAKNWENLENSEQLINAINGIGLAYCDISTGEFKVEQIDLAKKDALIELNSILNRMMPSEIILLEEDKRIMRDSKVFSPELLSKIQTFYDYAFEINACNEALINQFGAEEIKNAFSKIPSASYMAAGALTIYLAETQKRSLAQINKIKDLEEQKYLKLDASTRRNLEIIETIRERKKRGSLLWVIDNTLTSMGARLLKNWLSLPLQDEKEINARLDSVEDFVNNLIQRQELKEKLNQITDIERIAARIAYGNFNPRDAISLKQSAAVLPEIKSLLENYNSKKIKNLCANLDVLDDIYNLINRAIADDAPAIFNNSLNVIKEGYNKEFDTYKHTKENAADLVTQLEIKEREETGIKNLKINYNKVFGYFIEVTKSQLGLVPFRYTRKQTTTNSERFITAELKMIEDQVVGSSENAQRLQEQLFSELRNYLLNNIERLQKTAQIVAEIDVLMSLATIAIKNNYCKPKINSKIEHIKIVAGRHPVVEEINKNQSFVPNDTYINTDTDKSIIITGPNMAGKSTYMRQVALITLLAHIGSFVPAASAEICITDRIFTRVGASDDLAYGQSTFMVEMVEVANILNNATPKSLVILDEVGRGTSTFDGLSIAWAVMEYISNKMQIKTIFSTHYHELTELEGFLKGVKNYRITVKEVGDGIVFLRKVVRGGANKSFGVAVAALAGLPNEVIARAKEISTNLEKAEINRKIAETNLGSIQEVENIKRSYSDVIGMLEDVNVNMLTPLAAFDMLVDLVNRVKK